MSNSNDTDEKIYALMTTVERLVETAKIREKIIDELHETRIKQINETGKLMNQTIETLRNDTLATIEDATHETVKIELHNVLSLGINNSLKPLNEQIDDTQKKLKNGTNSFLKSVDSAENSIGETVEIIHKFIGTRFIIVLTGCFLLTMILAFIIMK